MGRVLVHTGPKTGRHLHVDCARKEYFQKKRAPKTNRRKADLMALLDEFEGQTADVCVTGVFRLPCEDLPEAGILRTLITGQRTADVVIRLTRGQVEISGAPIERIDWALEPKSQTIMASVRGRQAITIGEDYLAKALEWIHAQYLVFVKGQTVDE